MRKVFISTIKMKKEEQAPVFQSRDFDLGDKKFFAPISYLMDANLEAGDDVLVLTGVTDTDVPRENYEHHLKPELQRILEAHQVHYQIQEVKEPDIDTEREIQDSLTFSEFFRAIADCLQDGDRIYADMTYGMKCYTLGMFIAMAYAAKAGVDVDVERMIYAQFYKGEKETPATSDIIDITSLFYINTMVSNAASGQKKSMDNFLKLMIG